MEEKVCVLIHVYLKEEGEKYFPIDDQFFNIS
jgi:hypothetical protein